MSGRRSPRRIEIRGTRIENGSALGRVGAWCFRHGWWVLAIWTVAVAAGVVATGPLFNRLADSGIPRDVESVAATDIISAGDDSAGTIIGVVDHVDPASPQVRDAVAGVAQRLAGFTGVRAVEQPFALSLIHI